MGILPVVFFEAADLPPGPAFPQAPAIQRGAAVAIS